MQTKKLMELSRKERADRTYQRIVYRKLVDLQSAIWEANRQGAPIGELAEIETRRLVENLCKLADIEYRSPAENPAYESKALPSVETVTDVPIIDLEDEPEF